ncbi:EGF-like repeat and discoidin I-like domain-containing protein 3 [Patiria miniata]|uniref:F5/8 type C domain-containing protein n=1 Tax=Patiria miniata TaxID=46514 RepID=A0A914A9Z8_PATMI|nr:EGF-like repeat and discoidin I-like domain-containing protein 3 [Patiria miniata]
MWYGETHPAGTEKPIQAVTENSTQGGSEKPTPSCTEKPTAGGTENPTPAAECSSPQPLGMEDGTIQDDRITASSSNNGYPATDGRLNNHNRWLTGRADGNPWIEVDLVRSTVVTGVTTQGSPGGSWYVMRYKVAYQQQPSSQRKHVTDGNRDIKVFIGNTDSDTPVTNLFDESVEATVVRIEPTEWNKGVALRLELLGCRRD